MRLLASLLACLLAASARAQVPDPPAFPPPLPLGEDAYRRWDLWPLQRIGMRAVMRATHDRDGGNRTADASHFLYAERPDFNVFLDLEGRGVLAFLRTNRWHGSPWTYEIDGRPLVVRETATADPLNPRPGSAFEPAQAFPPPLAWTWSATRGANLNWTPMPFARSLRLAHGRTHYGTGYAIVHRVADDAPLLSPLEPFTLDRRPDPAVLRLIGRAGEDLAPADIPRRERAARLEPGRPLELFALDEPATIRSLVLVVPRARAEEMSHARLRITWDGRAEPSVDAPLALFFGAGLLYNRDEAEHLVKAFPVGIRYVGDEVRLSAYFPMPFFRKASIEIAPPPPLAEPVPLRAWIRHEPLRAPPTHLAYFHATYRDHGEGEPGRDHVLLDTRGLEGSEVWSGSFIGTSFTFTDRANLSTLEGDPRFFLDDARSPQGQGTGTEEWGGGGDYWGGRTMTLPFAGHPVGAPSPGEARAPQDGVHSAYRYLLGDLFPFGRNARIQLEHGGLNEGREHYRSVAYWYGLPAASLVLVDALEIGNPGSEAAHDYRSPEASPPRPLTSRYDLGPDRSPDGAELHPPETVMVRTTRGASEFRLGLRPDNHGVLLRRTLDHALPDQRALVEVADGASPEPAWEPAGTWFTAGSTTHFHSFPPGELDPPAPVVLTSSRRLTEEELILPARLTRGRSSIRVRVTFRPVRRPLLPGGPPRPSAWSEIRYAAYAWVEPAFQAGEGGEAQR